MRRLVSTLLFTLLTATVAVAAGCGVNTDEYASTKATPTPITDEDDGGEPASTPAPGGGDPTPNPTTTPLSGAEVEPNDDHDTATPVTGNFSGTCGGDDVADIFTIPVTAGKTVTASITYSDAIEDDLDLYVSNYDYSIDAGDETIPPGDSPVQVSVGFPVAEDAFIEVFCLWTANSVPYTGTVTVQ